MTARARDRHPPRAIGVILNPMLRGLMRSPAGRWMKGLAVLEFTGTRSGRAYRVVVGWHRVDTVSVVFTPAPWRTNFRRGRAVSVRNAGHSETFTGTLVTDVSEVTSALVTVLSHGTSPQALGMTLPKGHTISVDDVIALDRAMIRFA